MCSLNTRALKIVEILKEIDYPISGLNLGKKVGCSIKTIQNEIKYINKELEDIKINSIRGVGYKLEGKINLEKLINDNLGGVNRVEFIIKTIINLSSQNKNSIKLEELADSMFISVSTIKNDLKEAREMLKKYNIEVVSKYKHGIALQAKELDIIKCIVDLCCSNNNELVIQDFIKEDITKQITSLEEILLTTLNEEKLLLSDVEFKNLYTTIFIKLSRENHYNYKNFIVNYIKDYKQTIDIIMNDNQNKEKIIKIIDRTCENLKAIRNIDISEDKLFKQCLYNHINNLIKKDKLGIYNYDEVDESLENLYKDEYNLARIVKKDMENILNFSIKDCEIYNIALHIGGAIERHLSNKKDKIFNVMLVCSLEEDMSILINNKLKQSFKDKINIVKTIPKYLINHVDTTQVDFVISTIILDYNKIPVVKISTFLCDEEIKLIERFMNNLYA